MIEKKNNQVELSKKESSMIDPAALGAIVLVITLLFVLVFTFLPSTKFSNDEVKNQDVSQENTSNEVIVVDIYPDLFEKVSDESILILEPSPDNHIQSPLQVSGYVRGTWLFEGDAPLLLVNEYGDVVGESYITATGEWMTEDFVPFTGEVLFDEQESGSLGILIFQKDNPSGLIQHDDSEEVSVVFK